MNVQQTPALDFASSNFTLRTVIMSTIIALITMTGIRMNAQGLGDLLVTPMRVVFEGGNRSQTLTLFNVSADTLTYDLSMIQYRMNEDGTFTQIQEADPGQRFADSFIRFFPRTVTLAPREAQNVRVQFRPAAGMENAEYRSHMFFRAVPRESGDDEAADTTTLAIKVQAVFGISIPVIVRNGDISAEVAVENAVVTVREDSARTPAMRVTLARTGPASSFGDVIVTWEAPDGQTEQVAVLKGIAVYTPNARRVLDIALKLPKDARSKGGFLYVKYINRSDLREKLLAESKVAL